MRVSALLAGVLATAALAAGCATPTPAELQAADEARVQVEQVLGSFAQALVRRDSEALKPLLSPYLRPADVRLLEMKLQTGRSLAFYKDYAPDFKKALASVPWEQWRGNMVVVEVPYADAYGLATVDRFRLHSREGRWHLVDFELKAVQPGDLLDPPDDVREILRGKTAQLLAKLKSGDFMEVYYALPQTSQNRRVERTWWEKATKEKPDAINLMKDLERLQMFTVLDWPKPEAAAFVYAPGSGVGVFFEIPYVWPEAGLAQTDVLRLQFIFLCKDEDWVLYQLRMSAAAIPWSQ